MNEPTLEERVLALEIKQVEMQRFLDDLPSALEEMAKRIEALEAKLKG